ncbi:plasmid mobilization relaxosome protein MobC [Xanthomonas campestris pv. campestris]|uniref:plasmid mobilization relaxosome protein MobC n=1 Tax=Xanthomonas TaxID=338 RepID=UPI001EEFC956|nr:MULTISPECIES: plasmid mobilization relaxosome protein MobC [Xanthomonas]
METPLEKPSRSLNLHLGPERKARWVAYCAARGKTPGAAICEAIDHTLATAPKEPAKLYRQTHQAPDEPKQRFEILLTASEKAAVRERANIERCSMNRWGVDAIRAGLTGEPQFGTKEVDTLGESNYQLLAIGRNLNQIARRLNEGKSARVTVEQIKMLADRIDQHTKKVADAIRASQERWNIE